MGGVWPRGLTRGRRGLIVRCVMSFLDGTYEANFIVVALGVGVLTIAAIVYMLRRFFSKD